MDWEGLVGWIAERKIKEAIDEGQFDNLPGKGKPLVFDDDPMTPPHLRMANKILKNANVLPDWMQVHKEIESERRETASLRARLLWEHQKQYDCLTSLPSDHAAAQKFALWHAKSREAYLKRLKGVNTAILKLSLMAPSTVQPIVPYRIVLEMESFDAEFPRLPNQEDVSLPAEAREEPSRLKAIARERYQK